MDTILFIIQSVYTDEILRSIYPMELQTKYSEFKKKKTVCWRGTFYGRFYQWNHWGIQTWISMQWRDQFSVRIVDGITDRNSPSVIPSTKVNISPLSRLSPPLFLILLPRPNSLIPNCKQPPPKKKSLSSQHKVYFFKFCGHSIRILIYYGFYHFL